MSASKHNPGRGKKKDWHDIAETLKEKKFSVTEICRNFGKSRAAFYKENKERQRRKVDEELILQLVRKIREIHPRAGVEKLVIYLKPEFEKAGVKIGRDKLADLLGKHRMLVEPRKNYTPKTTRYDESLPVASNLIKDIKPTAPNQIYVADITYIRTAEGFLYLSLITDLFSRMIVGCDAGESLETQGCLKALQMARKALGKKPPPIHHSDRGCQYSSRLYRKTLREASMKCSMTEELHCYENSVAERVNGILKQEYFLDLSFRTKKDALKAIKQAVYVYNHLRIHKSLDYKTPFSVHKKAA